MSSRDSTEIFGQLVHGTARAWRQKLDERLKPVGLSQAKWRTLMHLSLAGDALTQAELAARAGSEAAGAASASKPAPRAPRWP